ncbi:hypothetical protein DICVIV_01836 [Dictyocaulus viviparus]|uniref:Fibronectin type-III domain-containing protein n=1 Tax=Dictyocaulus viviparus TaxID=29172 RepID=A0A0D8Y5D2_DICVI|nr:hypothetical protein DICVIV_01836 [Dictyocaulus viviparus]
MNKVTDGSNSATFVVDVRKAYTFKVAAATMRGSGPFSPVLAINPDPAGMFGLWFLLSCSNAIVYSILSFRITVY